MLELNVTNLVGGNIVITTSSSGGGGSEGGQHIEHSDTRVTYTAESGYADWSGVIEGELSSSSIPNIFDTKTVDIGTSVTNIQDGAFSGCMNLTDVIISSNTNVIGRDAFVMSGLTNLTISDFMMSIGSDAFAGNSLSNVTIYETGYGNAQNVKSMLIDSGCPSDITWNMPT